MFTSSFERITFNNIPLIQRLSNVHQSESFLISIVDVIPLQPFLLVGRTISTLVHLLLYQLLQIVSANTGQIGEIFRFQDEDERLQRSASQSNSPVRTMVLLDDLHVAARQPDAFQNLGERRLSARVNCSRRQRASRHRHQRQQQKTRQGRCSWRHDRWSSQRSRWPCSRDILKINLLEQAKESSGPITRANFPLFLPSPFLYGQPPALSASRYRG